MKKKVISLYGELGAGKSTTTRMLVDLLGYKLINAGSIHRKRAEEMDVTLHEYHQMAEKDSQYDHYVDEKLKDFLTQGSEIICDSAMAAWFAPETFKVFLYVDPEVAAKRMFNDAHEHRKSESYESVEEQLEKNKERRANNVRRYKQYYAIEDYLDRDYYDIVVDTTDLSPKEVVTSIIDKYKQWLEA